MDIRERNDVRFTPKSGHRMTLTECPLSAKSRHSQAFNEFGRELEGAATYCHRRRR
jgi:hypothetical protein